MKAFLRRVIPTSVRASRTWRRTLGRPRAKRSWSKFGEDLILAHLVQNIPKGTYLDVGAFHPKAQSTTHVLYKQGWSGINVDAQPGSMKAFRHARRRDINLEVGVSSARGALDFFFFPRGKVSTFDPVMAERWAEQFNTTPRVQRVEVTTVSDLLNTYKPDGVDVLLVDAEGFDLAVLEGNDWSKYRPKFVVVEALGWHHGRNSDVRSFVEARGYLLVASTPENLFFRRAQDSP